MTKEKEKTGKNNDDYLVLLAQTYMKIVDMRDANPDHWPGPIEESSVEKTLDQIIETAENIEPISYRGCVAKLIIPSDLVINNGWEKEINSTSKLERIEAKAMLAAKKLLLSEQ